MRWNCALDQVIIALFNLLERGLVVKSHSQLKFLRNHVRASLLLLRIYEPGCGSDASPTEALLFALSKTFGIESLPVGLAIFDYTTMDLVNTRA